ILDYFPFPEYKYRINNRISMHVIGRSPCGLRMAKNIIQRRILPAMSSQTAGSLIFFPNSVSPAAFVEPSEAFVNSESWAFSSCRWPVDASFSSPIPVLQRVDRYYGRDNRPEKLCPPEHRPKKTGQR